MLNNKELGQHTDYIPAHAWPIEVGTNSLVLGDGQGIIKIYRVQHVNPFYRPRSYDYAQVLADNQVILEKTKKHISENPFRFQTGPFTWLINDAVTIDSIEIFDPPNIIETPIGTTAAQAITRSSHALGINLRNLTEKDAHTLSNHLSDLPRDEQIRVHNLRLHLYRESHWSSISRSLSQLSNQIMNNTRSRGVFMLDVNIMIRMQNEHIVTGVITDLAGDIRNISI